MPAPDATVHTRRSDRRPGAACLLLLLVPLATGCLGPAGMPAEDGVTGAQGPFSSVPVPPGEYRHDDDFAHVLERGPHEPDEPELVVLESDVDGVRLEFLVVRPKAPAPDQVPVVAIASTYMPPLDPAAFKQGGQWSIVEQFVSHGFAYAVVPVRGSSGNGGCQELMGPRSRADLDQVVRWLGEAPWSSGRVGMLGMSYAGSTQLMVAAEGNPYLRTAIVMAPVTDWYSAFWRNGTVHWPGGLMWQAGYPGYYGSFVWYGANPAQGRGAEETVQGIACPAAAEGQLAQAYVSQRGRDDPFGFYAARDLRPLVEENYAGSLLVMHGFNDVNVVPSQLLPWVDALTDRGLVVKEVWHQGAHVYLGHASAGPTVRWDLMEMFLRWFQRWLHEDTSVDIGTRVQVQDSAMRWRSASDWPPADAARTVLYLGANGHLSPEPTPTREDVVVLQPADDVPLVRDLDYFGAPTPPDVPAECSACLVLRTQPLDAALRFAGLPTLHLEVTPQGPGGHLFAYLYDEGPDGEATRLGWARMDLRFAAGGERPADVDAGERLVAHMQFEPLDAVVESGHRLVLEVSQRAPRWHAPAGPTHAVVVHVGDTASTLTLRTFDVDAAAFFEPPP